jgi:RHS repeat-associated protein
MRRAGVGSRWGFAWWLVCALAGVAACLVAIPGVAFAESSLSIEGSGGSSWLSGALVISGSPVQGEQARAVEAARWASPEARSARERSRTEFARLGVGGAAQVAREAFPQVIERPAGGPPSLPAGQRIVGYPTDNAARVDLGGRRHGVIASLAPIAVVGANGQRIPINLGLSDDGSSFRPVTPAVGVSIPKRLGEGVALSGVGVKLTPVSMNGSSLGGSEGALDGMSVLYANTQTDADTVVKPTTSGFEEDTLLRSVDSPSELAFRVGLPAGASLVQVKGGLGAVEVVREGVAIAVVLAPRAQDAAGTVVPVSMSLSGDTLTLSVADRVAEYQYPIEVDPEIRTVTDKQLTRSWLTYEESNWAHEADPANPKAFPLTQSADEGEHEDEGWVMDSDLNQSEGERTEFERGQWGFYSYETQGESRIYGFVAETAGTGSNMENFIGIKNHATKKYEAVQSEPASYGKTRTEVCVLSGCAPASVTSETKENAAVFEQVATNKGWGFSSTMSSAAVEIAQEKGPSASINTSSETVDGQPNIFYPGKWGGPRGRAEMTASDPGIGVYEFNAKSPNKPGWSEPLNWSENCNGVQCEPSETGWMVPTRELPNGEDTIEATAKDAVGFTAVATGKIKVDFTLPYDITIAGLPPNKELGEGQYKIKVSAKDEVSGVEAVGLKIDGKEVGKANGSCSPGPCTATGEWTVSGSEYPAGQHTITTSAISNAGDVAAGEERTIDTGHPAVPVALGPGSVSPQTGEFYLHATDVSVGGPGVGLSLKRSYNSQHLKAGVEGPLGPQWAMSVGGSESLTKAAEGTVVLTGGEGQESVFTSKGHGEFSSPPLSASLTLTEVSEGEKTKEFLLKSETGTVTKFVLPSGGSGSTFVPSTLEGPGATNVITYAFKTVGGITEPTEVLGPVPAGVSCTSELVKGCRALGFVYATKTTAKGEGSSEWGEYEGRLKEVTFTAWEPKEGKMKTTAVVEYVYDKEGRLRGEWDPRVSPALETTYGYDSEGHVTAMTSPGQQPWLFNYGTATGDPRARIVSVTRPSASTAAGNGVAPVNTVAPVLSSTAPVEGTPLSVTEGTWSNGPLAYEYQWEHCHMVWSKEKEEFKEECLPIPGATGQSYTPSFGDVGYTLKAKVSATNSDGSVVAPLSNTSGVVIGAGAFERKLEFGKEGSAEGQLKKPKGVAVERYGSHVWVADTGNNRIEEFNQNGEFVKMVGWGVKDGSKELEVCTSGCKAGLAGSGNGQFSEPDGIALDREGHVFVSDAGNKRVEEMTESGGYVLSAGVSSAPAGLAVGTITRVGQPVDAVYVALPGSNCIEMLELYGELHELRKFGKAGTGNGDFSGPTGIALNRDAVYGEHLTTEGRVYVTDTGNHRVEVLETTSETGKLEYLSQFGTKGSGNGEFSSPTGIALEPDNPKSLTGLNNDILVSDPGDGRWQRFNESYAYQAQYAEKEAQSIAVGGSSAEGGGEDLYVANPEKSEITEWVPGPASIAPPEPPNPGTSAVTTVEYNVPVSGAGAPYALGAKEVEAWGQKDDPTQATAIFPPDEPMGWPAKDYKRATVYYLDGNSRQVNVASPGGAISTTEYDSRNDVERTLSPDNRATSLKESCESKEKCKSAEKSKLLDTENKYNGETKEEQEQEAKEPGGSLPGTRLRETLGPQQTVRLANDSTVEARARKAYSYDEGAKELEEKSHETYGLPTKTTEGAVYSGKEEDVRETTMSYSGQENLGWKLHKPTSVTTEPGGLNLVHTTAYEPSTGNVIETKSPEGSKVQTPTYISKIGSKGSGADELKEPNGIAVDSSGNLWVADRNNQRLDKFNSKGEFVEAVGFGVANEKAEAETCTTSCDIGISGSGKGQFSKPEGIAFSGSDFYVSEKGNDRVQEFNEKGEAIAAFGEKGTAGGDFKEPVGIAVDASGNVWVVDYFNNRVEKFSSKGAFIEAIGFGVSSEGGKEEFEICTSSCRAGTAGAGKGQFSKPQGIAFYNGDLYVTDSHNNRVEEFNESGGYVGEFGTGGTGNGQFEDPAGIAAVAATGTLYVVDEGNDRVEAFSPGGTYKYQFGVKGTGSGDLKAPEGIAVNSSGDIYVTDTGNSRVEEWQLLDSGNEGAHDVQTIYYSTAANGEYKECGEHAEWANLPCETRPAAQPGTSGLPELAVTKYTYNVWDEPTTTTETVGSTTRTKTSTYEASGRLEKSAISSSVGTALPTVTDTYNKETGTLEKQSTTSEGKTKTITTVYNALGEMTSYTDAREAGTTYEYDIDGRIKKTNDGKGTETYKYNETTGLPEELVNEYGTTKLPFTATYDIEGNLLTEGYPNKMTAYYTYNQAGTPTALEYKKTASCAKTCPEVWFEDTVVPSIHGQWLEQTSTLSHQAYTYDAAGRLTQVQNTPAGKGCTTRVYTYDEDTNRTSLTTREPGAKGECTSEGGTVETHTYDSADRLDDTGVKYNEFGDITALPATDAGGKEASEELTSTYYTDNQLDTQTQNGQTIGYNLDPTGRTLETIATGKRAETITNHYAGPGSAPAWTVNTAGEFTRNIAGISGFTAVQHGTETPVLQLTNLHGDIIATASANETETKLLSSADTSEFGVPTTSLPPKYSWLGADEIPTELPSGVLDMGARSYVPQLGRFLQPDPIPGGSANAYTYTFGDPINTSDPSGERTAHVAAWLIESANEHGQEIIAREVARETLEREEAERRAAEAAAAAAAAGPQYEGEEGEEWEEEWEEEEYEYASYHHGTKPESEEGHVEEAVLVQPLVEEQGNSESAATLGSVVPLCKAGVEGPCAQNAGRRRHRRKKRSSASSCHVGMVPGDPDQGCCAHGEVVGQGGRNSGECDVVPGRPSPPAHSPEECEGGGTLFCAIAPPTAERASEDGGDG